VTFTSAVVFSIVYVGLWSVCWILVIL